MGFTENVGSSMFAGSEGVWRDASRCAARENGPAGAGTCPWLHQATARIAARLVALRARRRSRGWHQRGSRGPESSRCRGDGTGPQGVGPEMPCVPPPASAVSERLFSGWRQRPHPEVRGLRKGRSDGNHQSSMIDTRAQISPDCLSRAGGAPVGRQGPWVRAPCPPPCSGHVERAPLQAPGRAPAAPAPALSVL